MFSGYRNVALGRNGWKNSNLIKRKAILKFKTGSVAKIKPVLKVFKTLDFWKWNRCKGFWP